MPQKNIQIGVRFVRLVVGLSVVGDAEKMKFNFDTHPVARAYTLLVCHRFKKIDEEIFNTIVYHKRKVEDIQRSENLRRKLHDEAVNVLLKNGYTEKEAIDILENECERLIKEKFRELKEDEMFCGCCRVILKRKDWKKHEEEEKTLHNYLIEELTQLSKEAVMLKVSIAENKRER